MSLTLLHLPPEDVTFLTNTLDFLVTRPFLVSDNRKRGQKRINPMKVKKGESFQNVYFIKDVKTNKGI